MKTINQITEIEATEFENHVKAEKYFHSVRWFNLFFEVNYIFPEIPKEIDLPSWTHITNIVKIDKGYFVKVCIMNDYFIRNYEFILKYPIVSCFDEIRESTEFNVLRNL